MFHDVRFPMEISYGSKGGPKFSTSVITLASGKERRNVNWINSRAEYDVAHGIKTIDQMEELRDFFYARRGMAYSFRFRDWGDYEAINQPLGVGDGILTTFQMRKQYSSGGVTYVRAITKPVQGTVTGVTVNGVLQVESDYDLNPNDYAINYTTGIITFVVPPPVGHAVQVTIAEFDVHARFDTDHFDPVHEFWQTESWATIMVVEVKDD